MTGGPTPRQLRQRRERRRANAVAAASTVAVFGVLALVVTRAEGWPDVREAFFDGERIREAFPEVLRGFWLNVRIFVIAEVLILVVALLIAVARSSRAPALFPLRVLATVYTDVFRGVPIILVLFLLVFGVPALRLDGVPNDPVFWATVALVLSYSAYVSEVYRSGIDSVHETQRAAARAIGLTGGQAMRHVVLPQAVRRVIPPLLNDFIALQKETALVSVVGPIEAARAAQIDVSRSFNFSAYVAAALIFLAVTIPLTRFTDRQLGRNRQRESIGVPPVTALAVEGVRKAFGANVVLDGLDLGVGDHEVACLIGASGSGKSTLLRCIDLLEPVDDGRILLGGDDITHPDADEDAVRRRLGIVFQSFNLFPHRTVLDNVTLGPRKAKRVPRADAELRALALLERFGLADRAADHPDRLSGGQQQRVAIVRALAMEPELLLLDEITSALDPTLVGEVLDVIRELRDAGMTMVLATHEMGFAREIADTVHFLDGGRIVESAPPEQLFGSPREPGTQRFLERITAARRLP